MALLGLEDGFLNEEKSTWSLNKIGGSPDWMKADTPTTCCQICGSGMVLIVQLYCPLGDSIYHRTLYVLACLNKPCWSCHTGWTVVRSLTKDESRLSNPSTQKTSEMFDIEDDWGDESKDDWGDENKDEWGDENKDEWGNENKDEWGNNIIDDLKDRDDRIDESKDAKDFEVKDNLESMESIPTDSIDNSKTESILYMNSQGSEGNLSETQGRENMESRDFMQENKLKSALEKLDIKGERHPKLDVSSQNSGRRNVLVSHYISVIDEPSITSEDKHVQRLLKEYESKEGVTLSSLLEDETSASPAMGEKYEKSELKHGDKVFHHFTKRVSVCPAQCVRYQWNGEPLYISSPSPDLLNMRSLPCRHCGGKLTFELQLMPTLVNHLKLPSCTESAVEFGTVLVYSCKASCWSDSDSIRQEVIVIQQDPDHHLFK